MDLLKTLEFVKGFLEEKPYGEDLTFETSDDYYVDLFWHEPSLNVSWYPILQIEDDDKILFLRDGTENPDYWFELADQAIKELCG